MDYLLKTKIPANVRDKSLVVLVLNALDKDEATRRTLELVDRIVADPFVRACVDQEPPEPGEVELVLPTPELADAEPPEPGAAEVVLQLPNT